MLHVVTVALNNIDHTKELLRTLGKAAEKVPMRVIVVDNGSKDSTVEYLTTWGTAIQLFCFEHNTGVATAWNTGIRFAMANNADAILVCGNDTAPLPGTVERLYAAIQSGIPFITGTQCAYSAPADAHTVSNDSTPLLAAPDYSFFMFNPAIIPQIAAFDIDVEHQSIVQWQAQAAKQPYQMRMNPWDYGLFDSGYQLAYFEDNDHHLRAHHAGMACLRDQTALFRHDCSLTIRTSPELAELNKQTFPRNAERYKAKWSGSPQEVGPMNAKLGNITDEQWTQQTAGRKVEEIDRAKAIEDAKRIYAAHGVTA